MEALPSARPRAALRLCLLVAGLARTFCEPTSELEEDLFCLDGHRLPQLFLLGAQKCATTSLTYQMEIQWGLRSYGFFPDPYLQDPFKVCLNMLQGPAGCTPRV